MAENTRVEIGFVGGGAASASLDDAACKKLLKAVEKGDENLVELPGDTGTSLPTGPKAGPLSRSPRFLSGEPWQ